jgi:hypothetical protein
LEDASSPVRDLIDRAMELAPPDLFEIAKAVPTGPTARQAYDVLLSSAQVRGKEDIVHAARELMYHAGREAALSADDTEALATGVAGLVLALALCDEPEVLEDDVINEWLESAAELIERLDVPNHG